MDAREILRRWHRALDKRFGRIPYTPLTAYWWLTLGWLTEREFVVYLEDEGYSPEDIELILGCLRALAIE